ncbi:MAG: hypothetical protein Q4A76_05125, partial [Porphyromonadaceae bacterium]|nr:hypothetical protein [Porphyromonadaceae bacterium]
MKRFFTLLLLLAACYGIASAQWNTDSIPVKVLDRAKVKSSTLRPKAVLTKDGKLWVSYLLNEDKNNHTYLQLLDPDGRKMFEGSGLLVNNQKTPFYTNDYGLLATEDGSVIVTVHDARYEPNSSNGLYIFNTASVYKIGQDKKFIWGENGIDFKKYNTVCHSSLYDIGGDIYYYFVNQGAPGEYHFYVDRIKSDGTFEWSEPKQVLGQIYPSDGTNFFRLFYKNSCSYIQKYNRDFVAQWQDSVLFDTYSPIVDFEPYHCCNDGKGGLAIAYEREMNENRNVRVQYVKADGTLGFDLIALDFYSGDDTSTDHFGSQVYFHKGKNQVLAACTEVLNSKDRGRYYALTFNAFSDTGKRLFGDGLFLGKKESATGSSYSLIGMDELSGGDMIIAYLDEKSHSEKQIVIERRTLSDGDSKIVWQKRIGNYSDVADAKLIVGDDVSYL